MKIKVAVAQYEVTENVEDSIKKLDEIAYAASFNGAKLLVTPETSIGMLADVKDTSDSYLPRLLEIAKKNSLYMATSFYIKEKGKYFNQGYIVSDKGEIIHGHRKIYLAPPEFDENGIAPGHSLTVSKSEFGNMGMLICKDGFNKYSHFLYQKFNELEADIVCIPTWSLGTWEVDTYEYVKSLYTYGAFISRSFILMSGNLNVSTKSYGGSLIIDPIKGVIREGARNKKEIIIEEIDTDVVRRAREFDSSWQPKKQIV